MRPKEIINFLNDTTNIKQRDTFIKKLLNTNGDSSLYVSHILTFNENMKKLFEREKYYILQSIINKSNTNKDMFSLSYGEVHDFLRLIFETTNYKSPSRKLALNFIINNDDLKHTAYSYAVMGDNLFSACELKAIFNKNGKEYSNMILNRIINGDSATWMRISLKFLFTFHSFLSNSYKKKLFNNLKIDQFDKECYKEADKIIEANIIYQDIIDKFQAEIIKTKLLKG
jgi:hypothetical protein